MDKTLRAKALAEQPLVKPDQIKLPDISGKTVVMVPVMPDFKLFKQVFGAGAVKQNFFGAELITNIPGLPNAALCGPFIGGPQAVMLLEVLTANGARRFIFCGLCGGLVETVSAGSFFVAASAFSDEGAARHYSAESIFAGDAALREKLCAALERAKAVYSTGCMASIDAIFRETLTVINYYRARGCMAVDMETAALYAAARFHNVSICGVFVVSDVFGESDWRGEFGNSAVKASRRRMAEIIKEIV